MTSTDIDFDNPTEEDRDYIATMQAHQLKALKKLSAFTREQFEQYYLCHFQWSPSLQTWGHSLEDYANIALDLRTPSFIAEQMLKSLAAARDAGMFFIPETKVNQN